MAGPKTVTLVDKAGNEYNSSHPTEVINLIYGFGYKVKDDKMSPEQAVALLAEKNEVVDAVVAVTAGTDPTKQS